MAQLDQGRSIICILENLSRNTCALLNESDRQTDLQQGILSAGEQVAHMMATAHPDAALSWQRASEQQAALEECCPPAEAEPPCTYRPCEEPRVPDLPGLEAFEEMKAVRSKVKRVDRVERPS